MGGGGAAPDGGAGAAPPDGGGRPSIDRRFCLGFLAATTERRLALGRGFLVMAPKRLVRFAEALAHARDQKKMGMETVRPRLHDP